MTAKPGATNDHLVPRMYLSRFAELRSSGPFIAAAPAASPEKSFVANTRNVGAEGGFYWGTTPDGEPHHEMERFLTHIEDMGAKAFRQLLDRGGPFDDALPEWPPRADTRLAMSWWIAAQLVRTRRQRDRLDYLTNAQGADLPSPLDRANLHLAYVTAMVSPVAKAIFDRRWGIGFSDACLFTSDNPVTLVNGRDRTDQLKAAEFWDIYLPLDPHRCLYLPGPALRERMRVGGDHRFKLHPGLGIGLNSVVRESASRHIFFHPDHDGRLHLERTPFPQGFECADLAAPGFLVTGYGLLPVGYGVQCKWLTAHPPPTTRDERDDRDPIADLGNVLQLLDDDDAAWRLPAGIGQE